ncbi:hypothetical protein STRTUCAR8_01434 [Streptomyces turgidiscabies Car8]|uniref:Uncharacterized protein n=1 Tax=Streptomyces turgidiscabies (strain Car8) TaxID=698760 RepID=L7F4V7_STRT8|nr:hypothetical protein STRTUCAR8_01434 [Streptomyces turgidiscabies Car8]
MTRGDARPGRIEVAHTAHASRRHRQPEATVHPTTGYTAPYGHECQSSGAPVRDHPAGRRRNAASARWGAVTAGAPPAPARACRSPRHSSSRAHQLIRGTAVVPVGLMHPALAENLIRAGERPRRALRPVPCRTVWPRVRGRFPATTNAGKRLYLLRHGGKEWLDEDRHSRIAVETRMGREVAGVEGLHSHVALPWSRRLPIRCKAGGCAVRGRRGRALERRHLPLLYHSILKSGGKQQVKSARSKSS